MKTLKKTALRFVSVIAAGAITATMLAGCGEKKSAVKKFEIWSHDSHSKSVVSSMVKKWNESEGKKLGVEIVYTVKEGDIQQATEMAFESDQGPDMFSSVLIEKNRKAGNIVSIEDVKGGKEWIESAYNPEDYDGGSFKGADGKVYCLPMDINTFGLVYNKDMFKKYGIVDENGEPTPPETFEEVREYAKRMTNPASQDYGIVFPMKWGAFYSVDMEQLMLGSCGKKVFDCVKGEYNFDGMKPIYEMYMGIKADGSYFPGSETLDNDMARAYFAERNIGMKFAGSYDAGVFNSQFVAKCDWGVAPYPVADKNNRYKQHMGKGGGYALSKNGLEKVGDEASLAILKFVYGDDWAREIYKEGMGINFKPEINDSVEPNKDIKGWSDFSKLVSISSAGYDTAGVEMTGEKSASAVFMEDVWTGNVSIDDAIADLNTRYNAGMKKYYKNNPDKDINKYIKPDWDIKIQK